MSARSELNPTISKRMFIRYMRDPTKDRVRPSGDLMAYCDSGFEREIPGKLRMAIVSPVGAAV
jgi:hypothetical protein